MRISVPAIDIRLLFCCVDHIWRCQPCSVRGSLSFFGQRMFSEASFEKDGP